MALQLDIMQETEHKCAQALHYNILIFEKSSPAERLKNFTY